MVCVAGAQHCDFALQTLPQRRIVPGQAASLEAV